MAIAHMGPAKKSACVSKDIPMSTESAIAPG